MKTIYKYKIETTDSQVLLLPKEAEILTVQIQNGEPHLWAMIDTDKDETDPRVIEIFGTGNPIPDGNRRYISSYQLRDGRLIFHVFERYEY